jgi:uncharacterized protein YndB with AHSA1/START domain
MQHQITAEMDAPRRDVWAALADDLGIELFERAGRALLWRAAGSSGPTIRNHCR